MNSHKCKKPFLCSCEVDELAEKTSDRMMEIVKEHFKTKEQMTAKEIAEEAYKYRNGDPIINWVGSLEHRIKEHAIHIAERAVQDEKNEYLSDTGDNVCDRILSRIKQLTEQE